ncbi:DUF1592 domain-containing protein [Stratiformator vulcanicus]|uniref:Planctomycete cytochrome C n=1 Tax=Stratiformator vulcanicus TaxID=2527980 RepID=A0A517QZR4_9PLAN|nr:DUF1592 domain-containing protein [Stratiformator vulcanicus]QDT37136.1 hypothetical protein Pan189_15040 [Stratiformator vulcanicus]
MPTRGSRSTPKRSAKDSTNSKLPLLAGLSGIATLLLVGVGVLAWSLQSNESPQLPHQIADAAEGTSDSTPAPPVTLTQPTTTTADDETPTVALDSKPPLTEPAELTRPAVLTNDVPVVTVSQETEEDSRREREFLAKFCIDCHDAADPAGNFAMNEMLSAGALMHAPAEWQPIVERLIAQDMPPDEPGQDRPSIAEYEAMVDYLKQRLAEATGNAGRWTRRLNRAEYDNTMRDLLLIDYSPADSFPQDLGLEGFDNVVDVQTLAPTTLEKYLDSAAEGLRLALVDEKEPTPFSYRYFPLHRDHHKNPGTIKDSPLKLQELAKKHDVWRQPPGELRFLRLDWGSGSPPKNGGWSAVREGKGAHGYEVVLPPSGDISRRGDMPFENDLEFATYRLRVQAYSEAVDGRGNVIPNEEVADVVYLGFFLNDVKTAVEPIPLDDQPRWYEFEFSTDRQKPKVTVGAYSQVSEKQLKKVPSLVICETQLIGPLFDQWPPASHRAIVGDDPNAPIEQIIERFATRAFRRPATSDEVRQYVGIYELEISAGSDHRAAMEVALQAVLVSPSFLFMVEESRPDDSLNDYEIASRLSYFLWSTMPDEELLSLAADGRLRDDAELRQQVERMLADAKSEALVQNFASQWIGIRRINDLAPDPAVFPEWDDALREAMKGELEHLVRHVLRENGSIVEFLNSDETFLNQRLARHYGIDGVRGGEFRQVSLTSTPQRGGLTTTAGILALGAQPTRSAPVKRGVFIVEKLFNRPPPNPPANVPPIDEEQAIKNPTSVRAQIEAHRANPSCASCHEKIDYWGLPMERFDGIGGSRDIPASELTTVLPDGRKINGPEGVRKELVTRREEFARGLSEKLMLYALGRTLTFDDKDAIPKIVDAARSDDYRFETLIKEVVLSKPFLTH